MSYDIAQYKYTNHMREHYGLIGEIEYPCRTRSHQDENGNWLLTYPCGKIVKTYEDKRKKDIVIQESYSRGES